MQRKKSSLEKARIAEGVLSILGVFLLLVGLNARWAANHFPIIIYFAVFLSFAILGMLFYFIAKLMAHLRRARNESQGAGFVSPPLRMFLGVSFISSVVDALYATLNHSWNDLTFGILMGLLFGIATIPFHVLHTEYARAKVG